MSDLQSATHTDQISIIMRTKDRPLMLKRALRSVVDQTYLNWELLIVNDGGRRDEVDEVCAPYSRDPRVTVIHLSNNVGMEAASNVGLASARGSYLAIHDDDDTWDPEFLMVVKDQIECSDDETVVGVAANCVVIKERILGETIVEVERTEWDAKHSYAFEELFSANVYPPICLIYKTDAVRQAGCFTENMRVLGDWEFMLRLLTIGNIECNNRVLAYYHWRGASIDDPSYKNSIIAQEVEHEKATIRLRNQKIREFLKMPGAEGALHALIPRLARVERMLVSLQQSKNVELDKHVIRSIATEVWFERQRWGIWHKLKRLILSKIDKS